ncbi:EF-hand domain-containing protein [Phyllobacterium myrsinacearum]|uniref:Ca2+-binding EF-hand superfamily protein n=1 Tax=Phyllobacterium myrsinacearum TaxID=28101 RepID=A0A839ERH2_9HYPH|nr:calcium-binding protein [Phyllobacterium myrsinacearum]MBA8881529.1 Ca2+-binding EF-hand superfamily protein [Phyllobacterium myrsinacearum]
MKRITALVLSGTFLTVFAVGGALAQTETPAKDPAPAASDAPVKVEHSKHAKIDANDDGVVDLAEFTNMDRLKQADTNGDGTLSKDEIDAMALKQLVEQRARRITNRLDVNGDGVVTIAEVEKQKAKRFAVLDRNDDGKLEKSELRHGWKHHKGGEHGHKHRHHNDGEKTAPKE